MDQQNNYTLFLSDLAATHNMAQILAESLQPGFTFYLQGDLGVGKTTFVRELLMALGHSGPTKSPTYSLVETYSIANLVINHFDLYRLTDPIELEFIGIRDYLVPNAVNFFEWASKGQDHIPNADLVMNFSFVEDGRVVELVANSLVGGGVLRNLRTRSSTC